MIIIYRPLEDLYVKRRFSVNQINFIFSIHRSLQFNFTYFIQHFKLISLHGNAFQLSNKTLQRNSDRFYEKSRFVLLLIRSILTIDFRNSFTSIYPRCSLHHLLSDPNYLSNIRFVNLLLADQHAAPGQQPVTGDQVDAAVVRGHGGQDDVQHHQVLGTVQHLTVDQAAEEFVHVASNAESVVSAVPDTCPDTLQHPPEFSLVPCNQSLKLRNRAQVQNRFG